MKKLLFVLTLCLMANQAFAEQKACQVKAMLVDKYDGTYARVLDVLRCNSVANSGFIQTADVFKLSSSAPQNFVKGSVFISDVVESKELSEYDGLDVFLEWNRSRYQTGRDFYFKTNVFPYYRLRK
tara:strand:+ start:238 stop:615 length:378 start_codon:yes stop_codon:yes gene_type:complete